MAVLLIPFGVEEGKIVPNDRHGIAPRGVEQREGDIAPRDGRVVARRNDYAYRVGQLASETQSVEGNGLQKEIEGRRKLKKPLGAIIDVNGDWFRARHGCTSAENSQLHGDRRSECNVKKQRGRNEVLGGEIYLERCSCHPDRAKSKWAIPLGFESQHATGERSEGCRFRGSARFYVLDASRATYYS